MSAKAIREATGKDLLNRHLHGTKAAKCEYAVVSENTNLDQLLQENPWLGRKVILSANASGCAVCLNRAFLFVEVGRQARSADQEEREIRADQDQRRLRRS